MPRSQVLEKGATPKWCWRDESRGLGGLQSWQWPMKALLSALSDPGISAVMRIVPEVTGEMRASPLRKGHGSWTSPSLSMKVYKVGAHEPIQPLIFVFPFIFQVSLPLNVLWVV